MNMKHICMLLTALLLAPLAAQAATDGTLFMMWDFVRSRDQEILITTFREEDAFASNGEATTSVKANRTLVSKGGTP